MDDYSDRYYGINRTLCAVLDAMRKLNEARNYGPLASLVEEAQIMADRMESALYDLKDVKKLHEDRRKLIVEVKALKAEVKAATEAVGGKKKKDKTYCGAV